MLPLVAVAAKAKLGVCLRAERSGVVVRLKVPRFERQMRLLSHILGKLPLSTARSYMRQHRSLTKRRIIAP